MSSYGKIDLKAIQMKGKAAEDTVDMIAMDNTMGE